MKFWTHLMSDMCNCVEIEKDNSNNKIIKNFQFPKVLISTELRSKSII